MKSLLLREVEVHSSNLSVRRVRVVVFKSIFPYVKWIIKKVNFLQPWCKKLIKCCLNINLIRRTEVCRTRIRSTRCLATRRQLWKNRTDDANQPSLGEDNQAYLNKKSILLLLKTKDIQWNCQRTNKWIAYVPQNVFRREDGACTDQPKSAIFNTSPIPIKMFSGLISRWMTCFLWQYWIALTICRIYHAARASENLPRCLRSL